MTEDRFRFPGVDPASRVMIDILWSLWVETVVDDPRLVVEPLAMGAEVDVDDPRSLVDLEEARARLEEEEPILLEAEAPRLCLDIDRILQISPHVLSFRVIGHTLRTLSDAPQHTYP